MKKTNHLLILLVGMNGSIGTTFSAGVGVLDENLNLGLMTEAAPIKKLNLPFVTASKISVAGWDIDQRDLYKVASSLNIVPHEILAKTRRFLSTLKPRAGYTRKFDLWTWFNEELHELKNYAHRIQSDNIIVVNLLPTEPKSIQEYGAESWEKMQGMSLDTPGVTLSRLYFRLAIELGAHFINFTPNNAETPALIDMATKKGIIFSGRDGKSGQTFLKTVIAPAFMQKNLYIDGWYSTNLIGNKDGLALSTPDIFETKQESKSRCLEEILGYAPGTKNEKKFGHQVHIHYYPPRGDAKESWDNIDFKGFLGQSMQLKLNWLGKDSILAAPMVLDLIRITDLASRNGYSGVLEELALFYKSPLSRGQRCVHDFSLQYNNLIGFLENLAKPVAEGDAAILADLLMKCSEANKAGLYMHASENLQPLAARLASSLEVANRYSLRQNENIEKSDIYFSNSKVILSIKSKLVESIKKLLNCSWVSLAPLSGLHAWDLCISALIKPNEKVVAVASKHGGHPSIQQIVESYGAEVVWIPFDDNHLVDVSKLMEIFESQRPSMILFGISDSLRVQDLSFVKDIPNSCIKVYDCSQTLGLIIGETIINPLCYGFDLIISSTHKTFPGPHKGLVGTNNLTYAEKIENITLNKVSSDHTDHMLALGIALVEFMPIANEYAKQCHKNVKKFVAALKYHDLDVVSEVPSETHQVWIRFKDDIAAKGAYKNLESVGIYTNLRKLPFGYGWGLRVGVHEATLKGFKENDCWSLAELFKKAITNSTHFYEVSQELTRLISSATPMMPDGSPISNKIISIIFKNP